MEQWPIKSKSSSPTPRKFLNYPNELAAPSAPFRHDPEGSCCQPNSRPAPHQESIRPPHHHPAHSHDSTSSSLSSPPACLKWAHSLHALLQDPDGVREFQKYLKAEGQVHADALDFWFACEGYRKQEGRDKICQLAKVIYKKYVKSALPFRDELREGLRQQLTATPPLTLFDEAQAFIETLISKTTYPNFLNSDAYLRYLESVQNPSSSSGSSSEFSNDFTNLASGSDPLPTVHEDVELIMSQPAHVVHNSGTGTISTGYHTPNFGGVARLTKDLLLMSQKQRATEVRPRSEAYASMFAYNSRGHPAYNSYNPVSRQDSISSHSDARTESDLSMTDSSVDGRSLGRSSRRQAVLEARQVRESAAMNREAHMNQIAFIPRTQRLMDSRQCQPLDRDQFVSILTRKLEQVKKEQDAQELLNRKLAENDAAAALSGGATSQSRELANAIREKLQLEDDNDQKILDEHVSRVFSDLTPTLARSPPGGAATPRRHAAHRAARASKKDKDGFSTFSSDSGNVHDFAEVALLPQPLAVSSTAPGCAMVKSRSMPEYADEVARFVRSRRSSRRTLNDLTDSGVSVVSSEAATAPAPIPLIKDSRVLAWLMDSDTSGRGGFGHTHSEIKYRNKAIGGGGGSGTPPRYRKGGAYGSRSSSLERSGCPSGEASIMSHPLTMNAASTAVQLEEVSRRLEDVKMRPRQRSSSRHYPEAAAPSSQSTLKKSTRASRQLLLPPPAPALASSSSQPTCLPANLLTCQQQNQGPISGHLGLPAATPDDVVTTVMFSFCDEQFPYRTKIPGAQITLRQFKEYLPKKGNYRFFFKTICEDLDNQVIQEEVSNDADVLPLWEGKIMAQVKPID